MIKTCRDTTSSYNDTKIPILLTLHLKPFNISQCKDFTEATLGLSTDQSTIFTHTIVCAPTNQILAACMLAVGAHNFNGFGWLQI